MTGYVLRLLAAVRAVCPGAEVAVGRRDDRATWSFDPPPEATAQQLAAAQAVIDAFDDSPEAQAAWEEDQKPERKTLRQNAQAAVDAIDAYLKIADTANNAQVRAQVKLLSQVVRRLVRFAVTSMVEVR